MALPAKLLLSKTQLVYHLNIRKDKIERCCVPLEKYPAEPGTVGHSYRYLLKDVVQSIMDHVADRAKGRVLDDPKARAEIARAVKIETSNAIEARQYVSKIEILEKQGQKAGIVARSLDSIVPNVKRRYPNIRPEHLAAVSDEIARARNALADTLLMEIPEEGDDEGADDDVFD